MHQNHWIFNIFHIGADIVNNILGSGQIASVAGTDVPVVMGESPAVHFLYNVVHHIGGAVVAAPGEPEQAGGITVGFFVYPVVYFFINL